MSKVPNTMVLAAVLVLGTGVTASATSHHRRAVHGHHHAARPYIGPSQVTGPLGDDAQLYGPRYHNGADDDLSTDGSAIGREGDLIARDGSPRGSTRVGRAPGFELEAPPIGPSLPVVPELYDPDLR